MKRNSILLILFVICSSCTVQQVQQALGGYLDEELTQEEVIAGLKEALIKGISEGAGHASKVNGYLGNPEIKIPFPPDVQKVERKLRDIGLGNQVDKFVETLNRGAEEAAKEAKPIFVDVIKGMTLQDAWGILKGTDDAATQYLKDKTTARLTTRFQPVIKKALDQTSATRYYADIINTYNKIPLVDDVDPDLENYATARAIDGLFKLIADEEKKIRANPAARTTDLLKKVFKAQD